ncbi:hypothetical protein AB9K26_08790 [Psychroserpens sp. XS_ASV72]|uniref:hypothetical protein n=1 Tax=Psychroserpens sp. XS_ASV72 TaxID=3241293 RepID=UPI00351668A0
MKQDIRELFKTEDEHKPLPEFHRDEFLQKLKKQNRSAQKPSLPLMKFAAILLITLSIGFLITKVLSPSVSEPTIKDQMATLESQYLKDIDNEWQKFVAIAEDDALVERFRKKLESLDQDYKEISKQYKLESNNILIIEELVNNLKTRLSILKDIQSQIKLIHQKNEQHENTI